MAHEFESGLFVATPAWHGLGVVLPNAPSIDEAIIAAGLDWQVVERPLFLQDGSKVETHRAMVRDRDNSLLGVVGSDFTPLQNSDAFDWFRPIVESGEVTIEAAGSLRDGKRVWILAALKDGTAEVKPGDAVKSHVLMAHGHDGSLAIRAGFTKTRVVCANTLAVAMRNDAQNLVTLRHTSGAKVSLEKARESFDMHRAELKTTIETYKHLASRKCDDKNLVRYLREVLKPGSADDAKITVRGVDDIAQMFTTGRGAELSRGTLWGAFNAVTEHMTHERGRGKDSRQNSNWFGNGSQLADRALAVAVQFAEDAPLAELSRECLRNTATAANDFGSLLSRPARISTKTLTETTYDEAMARS
jgi:phage/plasmid-like protein (TIGR03299 family)